MLHFLIVLIFSLTINMRTKPDQKELQDWLIELGEGRNHQKYQQAQNGYMLPVPDQLISHDLDGIIDFCFPPALFKDPFANADAIANNAILCPKNKEVDDINKHAMLRMEGRGHHLLSTDEPLGSNNQLDAFRADSTLEAVHNECPSGFPPHELFLKVL